MARTQRQSEYIVMVKSGYECQPEPTCRHTVRIAMEVGCTEVLFQSVPAQFLLVVTYTLPIEPEFKGLVAVRVGRTKHDAYH